MAHTTEKQHWHRIAPSIDAEPANTTAAVTHWCCYAAAHMTAYHEAISRFCEMPRDDPAAGPLVRSATQRYLNPAIAGFTAAAALKGWYAEQIHAATTDGGLVDEYLWEWISETGINPDDIASAATPTEKDELSP